MSSTIRHLLRRPASLLLAQQQRSYAPVAAPLLTGTQWPQSPALSQRASNSNRLFSSSCRLMDTQAPPPPPSSSSSSSSANTPQNMQIPSRLLIGFNCNKCDHRTHKLMSKKAYETGVVIITCEGCSSKHLIADHLGWFDTTQGKIGTIEDIIARKGGDREGNLVVRLRARDVLTGDSVPSSLSSDTDSLGGDVEKSKDKSSTDNDDEGLMEWLPKRADKAAGF